jgi:hypothetical protein
MEIFYILVLYSLIVMKKWALIAYVVIFFVRLVNIINSIRYASIFGESLYYWLNISELILMIIILVIGLIEYKEMD